MNNTFDFGEALRFLKQGKKVARTGWNGVGLWLQLELPSEYNSMTLPFLSINYPPNAKTTPNAKAPWAASQTDALAEDYILID